MISQKKTNFDDKLNTLSKKVTLNKTKHEEAETKLAGLTNKVAQIKHKWHFTDHDGYQNFLVFAPILSLLIQDRNKKSYQLDIDRNII